ncbi:MAG: hypothetical protein ACOYKN_14290 [Pirellula sp.]
MKPIAVEVERGACIWTFSLIDPNSKTVKEHGILQCIACGGLGLKEYMKSSACPSCQSTHFRPAIVKYAWPKNAPERLPECPLNAGISNRTGTPVGVSKNSIYLQSQQQTCSIRNNSKEPVLIQVERTPSWMHSNINWSDDPTTLNPGDEFCLEFTRDVYAPEAKGQELTISVHPTRLRSASDISESRGESKKLNLKLYGKERLESSWICFIISVGASLFSLLAFSNLLQSVSILDHLSEFSFYLSVTFFLAWSIQPGCLRTWLETRYRLSSNLENRELLRNTSKIYGYLVDRPYSVFLKLALFPAIYLLCVILVGFTALVLDLTRLRSVPLIRLALCSLVILGLAIFHERAYPEVSAKIIRWIFRGTGNISQSSTIEKQAQSQKKKA